MKSICKLVTLILVIFLTQSCKPKFNHEEEFKKINSYIESSLADSFSGNKYQYWVKDGDVIKLKTFDGDYPSDGEEGNWAESSEYYFNDSGNVFAYKANFMNLAEGDLIYSALIYFSGSSIAKESYTYRDTKISKDSLDIILKPQQSSVEKNIILDEKTKQSKGLLMSFELAQRLGIRYIVKKKEDVKEKNSETSNSESNPVETKKTLPKFSVVRSLLLRKSAFDIKEMLGEPDERYFINGESLWFFYEKVVDDFDGQPRHISIYMTHIPDDVQDITSYKSGEQVRISTHGKWVTLPPINKK